MGLVGGIVIFILMWWMVFFAILPWGVATQAEHDAVEPGTDPGAPAHPGMGRKFLFTTVIAMGLWLIIYVIVATGLVTVDIQDPNSIFR